MYLILMVFISCYYRILVRYLPDFAGHNVFVNWQIMSEYSEEMSQKSSVV